MTDKRVVQQVLGGLMARPSYLVASDKYNLTPQDFPDKWTRKIFRSIYILYTNGASVIRPIDIENLFSQDPSNKRFFEQSNGIEYLQDLQELAEVENFDFYYNQLKKINLLNDLKKDGIDISDFYIEDLLNPKANEVNRNFDALTVSDIIMSIKSKILHLENNYAQGEQVQIEDVSEGLDELIEGFGTTDSLGLPLQGNIYSTIIGGAVPGTLTIRSGSSGLGKTRTSVMDMCYLSLPVRYNSQTQEWMQIGYSEKSLYIVTEQTKAEIQRMILAYLTDINEDKFKYGLLTEEEKRLVRQAQQILTIYKENIIIVRMPGPTIGLIKSTVREQCILHDISYVFYDYIFIGPELLSEYKGFSLRNDEILLMVSTALKDLAVELNVAMFTATQVNAKSDDNRDIKNEAALAGSRSIINKADNGAIMSRPTRDEIELLSPFIQKYGEPNLVTDIYKVRSGRWTQVRIWSRINLGTLKKEDLFLTNSRLELVEDFDIIEYEISDWDNEEIVALVKELNNELSGNH